MSIFEIILVVVIIMGLCVHVWENFTKPYYTEDETLEHLFCPRCGTKLKSNICVKCRATLIRYVMYRHKQKDETKHDREKS